MASPSEWKININDQAEIERFNQRLEKGPLPLLKSLGAILVRESKDAFTKQAFGSIKWKPRYPNQSGAKLNIAGALMDLGKGPKIKERRFQDRPAVIDTGILRSSITSSYGKENVGSFYVHSGTTIPYAQKQHAGGVSKIPITNAMRVNFEKVWDRFNKQHKKSKKGRSGTAQANAAIGVAALRRLAFLRNEEVTEYSVDVVPRPFVGITSRTLEDIEARISEWTTG